MKEKFQNNESKTIDIRERFSDLASRISEWKLFIVSENDIEHSYGTMRIYQQKQNTARKAKKFHREKNRRTRKICTQGRIHRNKKEHRPSKIYQKKIV